MTYTEEEINKYLNILHNYNNRMQQITPKSKCKNCSNTESFTIDTGLKICDECGTSNGHVLGLFDIKDLDRLYYRKKSIYYRKYHYEKKVNEISKIINLNDETKCKLYINLLQIDENVMEKLNEQYFRKRLINIVYLIKRLLEEMEVEASKLIKVKISPQTLEIYDKWWADNCNLKKINII